MSDENDLISLYFVTDSSVMGDVTTEGDSITEKMVGYLSSGYDRALQFRDEIALDQPWGIWSVRTIELPRWQVEIVSERE